MNNPEFERLLNEDHLRLLRIGYLIEGGVSVLAALFGVFYAVLGAIFFSALPGPGRGGPPPAFIGGLFLIIGLFILAVAVVSALLRFLTARALRLRRARVLCLITAGLSCLSVPYGTVLGIMTFIVLARPGVQRLFAGESQSPPAEPPAMAS